MIKKVHQFGHYSLKAAILFGVLSLSASIGYADGVADGVISDLYGSTRALDAGNDISGDAECLNTAGRGNLMDFFAMSMSANASGTNDPWYFSWTVDSSQALDDTAGTFFGMPATIKANYLIGIEVACDGAPRLEMWENGQPWEREFAWNVDYFIAMYPNGPNSMEAQLWRNDGGNNRSMIVGGIAVTSRVAGLRRQMEFVLPSTTPVPEALRNNSALCLYLLSVQDIDGSGTVLDGVGLLNHNLNCEAAAFDLSSLGSVFINTAANCKETGRPTESGANSRQCLSNPRLDMFAAVNGEDCAPPFGISIDGVVDSKYTLLSENAFAAPYNGGSQSGSDFVGESSARTYTHVASGVTNTLNLTGGKHADIENVYAYADTNFLYLIVSGPTSLGWELEPDLFNMYIAIDMPGKTTGNDTGTSTDLAPGAATAPAGRMVNFKGWDPDYAIELVWRGVTQGADMPANLYSATGPGTWSSAGAFLYQDVPNSSAVGASLYYSRTFPQYEFAVPWSSLGLTAPPASSDIIRLGVYTTGDENILTANESAWDIADQAPGIGQGCGGEGCHERVGDDALDDDNLSSAGSGDRTPFVGRSYGNPEFVPATDNARNDVDTIEEYFALRIDLPTCVPAIQIEKTTNGDDADTPTGPLVATGSVVTWTYEVTNIGGVPLTNVVVYDNQIGLITNFTGGDANGNSLLETNETWIYFAAGFASSGQYANIGSVTGKAVNAAVTVSDDDPSHYFGSAPGVVIEKSTNGQDADTPTGPSVIVGSTVTWTYAVTNSGNVALTNVVVTDDQLGVIAGPDSGDVNGNGLLDHGEVWIYTTNGIATAGQYVNTGLVSAASLIGQNVNDDDPSHYFGGSGGIDIEKATNGDDADTPTGPVVPYWSGITWTYVVRNTGNEAITNVVVNDSDIGAVTNLISGDANNNSVLETNEIWVFTATGIAIIGQYSNDSTVAGTTINTGTEVNDNDPSHYFGSRGGIDIEKATNGEDADIPSGPVLITGSSVVWTYVVTNTGNASLYGVIVSDDQLGVIAGPDSGDVNTNNMLDVGERWVYTTNGIVSAGQYVNTGYVSGISTIGQVVFDEDPSHYFGSAPGYTLNKERTNPEDSAVYPGGPVAFSITIVNTGNVTLVTVPVVDTYETNYLSYAGAVPASVNNTNDGTINWTNIGPLTPGASTSIVVHFTAVNPTLNTRTNVVVASPTTPEGHPGVPPLTNDAPYEIDAFASLGDFVWRDSNANGVQDGLETGVNNVIVNLLNASSNVIGVTTSDVNGAYAFTNLTPGTYSVQFIIPSVLRFTDPNAGGDDAVDSDANVTNGYTHQVTLMAGEYNDTLDAGVYLPAQLGDFVWNDLDANGVQDGGETGVAGVVVTLYNAMTNAIGVTTTDVAGAYAFTNLTPGSYSVGFDQPAGAIFSPQYAGSSFTDSDADPSTGRSDPVTLVSGEINHSIDAGIVLLASVGDFVWNDLLVVNGIQDPGEPGVQGVVLTLYTASNVVVSVTTSGVNGAYAFTNLLAGSYYIRPTILLPSTLVLPFQGGDTNLDSNVDTITGDSDVFVLQPGEHNRTIDVGISEPVIFAQVIHVEGRNLQGRPVLHWETISEYRTAGWYVEKRDESENWIRVSGFLPASGNISVGASYDWVDSTASISETNRYRVIEVETDGALRNFSVHDITYPEEETDGALPASGFSFKENSLKYNAKKAAHNTTRANESAPAGAVISGVKVAVSANGLYRISEQDIADSLGVGIDEVASSSLKVEYLGLPVRSMRIESNVIFYGNAYKSKYTDLNSYRITLNQGEAPAEERTTGGTGVSQHSFMTSAHFVEQLFLRPDLCSSADDDPWLWRPILTGFINDFKKPFELPNLLSNSGGELTVRLKGLSTPGGGYHGVRIYINNTLLSEDQFAGTKSHTINVTVPPGMLRESGNEIKVESSPPPGVAHDMMAVDSFTVDYRHRYVAVSNELVFTANAGSVKISGFSTNTIEVWNVDDCWKPVRLTGASITPTGSGWQVSLDVPRKGRYIASIGCNTNAQLRPWYEQDLKSTRYEVDYLVVHAPGLESGSAALASRRASQGLQTKVVDIESVYNTFNYGIVDGRVLKTFLSYAYYQWKKGPRYLVLVGDGTMDYKNVTGAGDSQLPTEPERSAYGLFSSDHDLADVNNDGRIEVAVGRIPVTTPQQLSGYIAKLNTFEAGGAWRNKNLIATDDSDAGGSYISEGNFLESIMTSVYVDRADVDSIGASNTAQAIRTRMEEGVEMMLYIGHGTMYQMAEEPLLNIASLAALTNGGRPAVVGALSCLTASFTMPNSPSLGKTMINSEHGAVAMFGSASMISMPECREISKVLMESIYQDGTDRFGDAWIAAKNAMVQTNLLRVARNYQYMGDPALAMGSVNAPRGGNSLQPAAAPYDIWKTWAFPPAWRDLGIGSGSGDNPDGDNLTNEEELRAGTDPLDDDSELVVVNVRPYSNSIVEVTWPSVAGRIYRVERANNAFGGYTTIADDVPGTPPFNTHVDTNAITDSTVYRVYVK